jgi:hypothetical protein
MDAAVPRVGHSRVKPAVYLSPTAHPTSMRPASTRITHARDMGGAYRVRAPRPTGAPRE